MTAPAHPDPINVLLIGSGGREHALAEKLRQSPRCARLFVSSPENPGLASLGTPCDATISVKDPFAIRKFCDLNSIGLVVIGPEEPLAQGLADLLPFHANGSPAPNRAVFGVSKDGARLEADKAWAKLVMRSASVATAEGRAFTDREAAGVYLESRTDSVVIKASGLCKGKGVFLPDTPAEGLAVLDRLMGEAAFGDAGRTVVIEERLKGREVSVFALVDGRNIYLLEACRDYKRLGDGATGPNTGGMGSVCPAPGSSALDEPSMRRVEREILVPIVDALRREGIDYRGVLYAGLMLTPAGPKVLEFNVRFGDPECQALLARLRSDLLELCLATARGTLDHADVSWDPRHACCVVIAAPGYPDNPKKGVEIRGIEDAAALDGVRVYHAGTALDDRGRIVTAGGRALNVVALGDTLDEARRRAYAAAERIHLPGKQTRTDIGSDAPG